MFLLLIFSDKDKHSSNRLEIIKHSLKPKKVYRLPLFSCLIYIFLISILVWESKESRWQSAWLSRSVFLSHRCKRQQVTKFESIVDYEWDFDRLEKELSRKEDRQQINKFERRWTERTEAKIKIDFVSLCDERETTTIESIRRKEELCSRISKT